MSNRVWISLKTKTRTDELNAGRGSDYVNSASFNLSRYYTRTDLVKTEPNMSLRGVFLVLLTAVALARNPLEPTAGWTYYLEAMRASPWPSCSYRFLSYPAPACNEANLWDGAGNNQEFTLVSVPGAGNMTFYLQASCGHFLSYPGGCDLHTVDLWPEAGINQEWTFIPTGSGAPGEYFLVAQGRISCPFQFMSFPVPCSTDSPDLVDLWDAAGPEQSWRLYPLSFPFPQDEVPVAGACADPFVWESRPAANVSTSKLHLICTGGLPLNTADGDISLATTFTQHGSCLGGTPTSWLSYPARWAPETFSVPGSDTNVMFVCDQQPDGSHRIGYVIAAKGAGPNNWDRYSASYLQLSPGTQGDIDPHLFLDPATNRTYLVWKSDDNRIGLPSTRIWIQELHISPSGDVKQLAAPAVILDSTGLWWAVGFAQGASLVEGPEMVFHNGFYYLFFAAGRYCGFSYAEGVARASSPLGPFEKLGAPVLCSGLVGSWNGAKLRGPGHATFLKSSSSGRLFAIYHAHTDDAACNRYPFITEINFVDGWPRARVPF